jgi:hypothetical protein
MFISYVHRALARVGYITPSHHVRHLLDEAIYTADLQIRLYVLYDHNGLFFRDQNG